MLDKLKTDFDEILQLVKRCPTDLQETALKTLLDNWFRLNTAVLPVAGLTALTPAAGTPAAQPAPPTTSNMAASTKPFLVANSLTEAQLGKVYHPVGPGAQLVIANVPGKGKASQEISLALLLSVAQAIGAGTFGCGLEELRQMCLHYNCYDSPNFAATLNNNKTLFKSRKKGQDIELSASGMKKAADIIKSLAAEA